jgi:hypothetical protein
MPELSREFLTKWLQSCGALFVSCGIVLLCDTSVGTSASASTRTIVAGQLADSIVFAAVVRATPNPEHRTLAVDPRPLVADANLTFPPGLGDLAGGDPNILQARRRALARLDIDTVDAIATDCTAGRAPGHPLLDEPNGPRGPQTLYTQRTAARLCVMVGLPVPSDHRGEGPYVRVTTTQPGRFEVYRVRLVRTADGSWSAAQWIRENWIVAVSGPLPAHRPSLQSLRPTGGAGGVFVLVVDAAYDT